MSAREHAEGPVGEHLAEGRERVRAGAKRGGAAGLFALQRAAGNSAVSALLAGRFKSSGDAVADIDSALREVRGSEPDIAVVEKGLKATKAAGVHVDLEGAADKPPAAALAVVTTGFGPGAVAPKKPVPPPKPVKPVSPLGKAGAKAPKPGGAGGGGKGGTAGKAPATPTGAGGAAGPAVAAPLPKEKLLQPPVAPPGVRPTEDPAFAQVKGSVKGFAKAKKAHPPAASKAKEAQGAALAPADDVAGQAKAAKVDSMDAQQAGTFDKKAFIAAVKTAIEAKSPKTLKEADKYKESGKAGEVKGEVKGMVTQGKEGSAKDIEAATDAAPDQSKAVPKEVTPLRQEDPGRTAPIPAAGAVPKPAPAEQVNLEAGKHETNQEMADAEVSDAQLARSGEPEFQGALADKQKAAEHADKAPGEYRQQEKATLAQSKEDANAQTAAGVVGMQGTKGAAVAKLVAAKAKTKSKDEAKRAEVTARVQEIFAATETDVKKILDGIDPKVDAAFEQGEAAARSKFESYVAAKMSAYKRDRYGGWLGGLRWAKDKLLGMPDKVNEFYEAGRELYLKEMDGVISRVADIVGGDLNAAKQRIAKGRADIAAYVKTLSPDLQKVGSEAAKEIGDRFNDLEAEVSDKQNALVETLASKYVEARKGLDERIEALQAENKGLVDKAIGAIKAVINTIRNLAAMLRNVLARAASAIGDIISDPIGFLGNLIGAVKGGINKFFANIGAHLKKGLMGWLFGQLGDAGIEIPDTFDVKGIIKLLASIFGLTWANIRNRIVKQIGEKAMAAIEAGVDIFQKIAGGGISAVWEMLMEKLGNIKDMILEQIQDFVLTRIITAGITWLISLLNPAAAFIKACKLIYDVVMFFVNNAERIIKFVNTVIDGIVDIAKGNIGAVVDRIEDALSQMVPILIGFIASVLGIGGIGEKIKSIVQALQKPVNKALDFVIKQGLKIAGPIIRGIKGIGAKAKAKVAAGKAYVKGKVEAGKAWVKEKFTPWNAAQGFSAAGKSHTVSLVEKSKGAFEVLVASKKAPVGKKMGDTKKAAEVTHADVSAQVAEIAEKRNKIVRDAMKARKEGASLPPAIVALIGELSKEIARLWGQLKFDGDTLPAAGDATVDKAEVKAAIATAGAEKRKAEAKHKAGGKVKGEVWASGGGELLKQGAGEAPESGATLTEKTPWVAAEMAKFGELGPHHDIKAMTTLTKAAAAEKKRLEDRIENLKTKKAREKAEADLATLLRRVGSYEYGAAYEGRVKADREQHSSETGEWLPRRNFTDSGVPGYADVVHAEKNVFRLTGAQAIGVSTLPQCSQCQLWFKEQAITTRKFIVVASETVRVFMPNGDVKGTKDFK